MSTLFPSEFIRQEHTKKNRPSYKSTNNRKNWPTYKSTYNSHTGGGGSLGTKTEKLHQAFHARSWSNIHDGLLPAPISDILFCFVFCFVFRKIRSKTQTVLKTDM